MAQMADMRDSSGKWALRLNAAGVSAENDLHKAMRT
jgi:hypothetical protein